MRIIYKGRNKTHGLKKKTQQQITKIDTKTKLSLGPQQ